MTASGRPADAGAIAIIGIACRFPGADDAGSFWRNLCGGVESIRTLSDEELLSAGVDPALLRRPDYVRAAPLLSDIESFDASFFGYSPREAVLMDPQHRLFLEVAWEAFEDAGYHPETSPGVVGVVAGCGGSVTSYLLAHAGHPALAGDIATVPHIGNDKDFLATRVSYKLNLTGPSFSVQTACSTSLVAVHLAAQALISGECDLALAGAASVRVPHVRGYLAEKGQVHSADGHCRAFDASGQGAIFGSGVAAVLLRRLDDAVAAGDHVYAVIKATAITNDGGSKVSYTAPSVTGQARAMVEALTLADVAPETIRYVECHAAGTNIGDPLEVQALTRTFRTSTTRAGFCAIGSVKTNIGHPEVAAGMAGLIKTALALKHGQIPPSLHFVTPNPSIDFAASPFFVNTRLRDWSEDDGHPRRACVNSLGIGGTNAFAVLEEAPRPPATSTDATRAPAILTLSAKSAEGLAAYRDRVRAFLRGRSDVDVADLCFTSNVSRSQFTHRLAVTASSVDELVTRLDRLGETAVGHDGRPPMPKIAFLFTGQGAQYPGMAAGLYRADATFRRALDRCAAAFRPHLDRPLLDVMFDTETSPSVLHHTAFTQPALFALEYALAEMWRAWGVEPAALLGHSLGEVIAACVSGAIELEEAVELVVVRGRLMQELPGGGTMLAAFTSEDTVRRLMPGKNGVVVAAANSPQNTVISGARASVQALMERLGAEGVECHPLPLANGFHSPIVEPMLDALETAAGLVRWQRPRIALVSNLTGRVMTEAPEARYWRDHARQCVRFADGVRTLESLGCDVFLEIGPGSTLLGIARQVLPASGALWLPSLSRQKPDWQVVADALQSLYRAGVAIDWERVHEGTRRRRVSLPTYPFQRRRFWLDGPPPPAVALTRPSSVNGAAHVETATVPAGADVRDWLYCLRWEAQPRSSPAAGGRVTNGTWLVFDDATGVGRALAARLARRRQPRHFVRPGVRARRVRDGQSVVDPARLDDFRAVVREAVARAGSLAGVVYLWALDAPAFETMTHAEIDAAQEIFARGALHLSRALSEARAAGLPTGRLWLVTRNAQTVLDDDAPAEPLQALLWGFGRTLALESPGLWGGLVDLSTDGPADPLDAVALQLIEPDGEDQVAFRGGVRLVPRLARLPHANGDGARPIFRPDATYLITGGLGAIGLRTARWLVEREGVRSLVLAGRRAVGDAAHTEVQALRARGARVDVVTADVGVEADVRRLLARCDALPPLRGVIHGAGVLDNEIVERMDWDRFRAVTRAKVEGAWLLHRATRRLELDFFVLHSSVLSLTGSAGQANYTAANAFLDALAGRRQARGLPATVINWTAWDEEGLATTVGARAQDAWRANGWRYIPPAEGIRVFAELMHPPVRRAAVIIADWPQYLRQFPVAPPLYDGLAGSRPDGPAGAADDIRRRLASTSAPDRWPVLAEFSGRQVMAAMGFEEPVDPRRPLSDLGLDSLMAATVAARLETTLGVPVPVVKLIRGPSIASLVEELAPQLADLPGADATVTNGASARVVTTSKIEGDGWLVFPRPTPSARLRLFCFPYAGGNAATYRGWIDRLAPDIELVAVDPPGRAHRIHEAPIDDVDTFCEALLPAMEPFLDKPLAFFGHCLGGLTAFETARRLREQHGIDLRHLFVSGSRPPRRLNLPGRFEEDLLARLLKEPAFDPFVAAYAQDDEVVAAMIRQFNIPASADFLASPELRALLMPVIRAEFRMGARYRFIPEPPWETSITCFAGLADPYVTRQDALGWSEHTRHLFRLHLRDGAHFGVVEDRDFIVDTINREVEE